MNKIGAGFAGDNPGQGGFAATRRTPENHGKNAIRFNGMPNQRSLTDRPLLADKRINGARPHALGQRHGRRRRFLSVVIKNVHGKIPLGIFVIGYGSFVTGYSFLVIRWQLKKASAH
jgi:hypothetical protein